jgi:hypothetical protein
MPRCRAQLAGRSTAALARAGRPKDRSLAGPAKPGGGMPSLMSEGFLCPASPSRNTGEDGRLVRFKS